MPKNNKKIEAAKEKDACSMTAGEGIIASLTELRDALKRGVRIEKRFTMRTVDLEIEPSEYSSEDVKELRERMNASQAIFARLLGVSASTVRGWERGNDVPKLARRLLDTISDDPSAWLLNLSRHAKQETAC